MSRCLLRSRVTWCLSGYYLSHVKNGHFLANKKMILFMRMSLIDRVLDFADCVSWPTTQGLNCTHTSVAGEALSLYLQ